MTTILSLKNLNKIYGNSFQALKNINLEIKKGEILALLGPNGAGKTSLINCVCGINTISSGEIKVDGYDVISDYRITRSRIGLVPQELTSDAFETVWKIVRFSRGLFGKPPNDKIIEKILKDLSLWDKRNNRFMTLSGGMKRRVLIAKALSHEPSLLFLDEPTAGVDVELRTTMWKQIKKLKESGVTIILTTHYIEEAENIADRIGIINRGEIILVNEKKMLMKKLGTKELHFELKEPLKRIPASLGIFDLRVEKNFLIFTYDSSSEERKSTILIKKLLEENIDFIDVSTKKSSLEEIFIKLIRDR